MATISLIIMLVLKNHVNPVYYYCCQIDVDRIYKIFQD
jgi:hypothetical protein